MGNRMDEAGTYGKKGIRKGRSRRSPIWMLLLLSVCLFLERRTAFGTGPEENPWQLLLKQYGKDPGTDRLILVQYLGGSKGALVMLRKEPFKEPSSG